MRWEWRGHEILGAVRFHEEAAFNVRDEVEGVDYGADLGGFGSVGSCGEAGGEEGCHCDVWESESRGLKEGTGRMRIVGGGRGYGTLIILRNLTRDGRIEANVIDKQKHDSEWEVGRRHSGLTTQSAALSFERREV